MGGMPQVTPRAPWSSRPRRGRGRVLALVLASSCAQANALEGSLGEIVDLRFTSVEVARGPGALAVRYLEPVGEVQEVVLSLVVTLADEELVAGRPLDIGPAADGTARATLSRVRANDPIRDFAPVRRGTLWLEAVPELGKPTSGEWRVTLGEGGVGEGRTVTGLFEVDAVVALE
jgi:hypothetical protein